MKLLLLLFVIAFSTPAWAMDDDQDGLGTSEEEAFGTDPNDADSDGDGVRDGDEALGDPATDPTHPDTDRDGATDGVEKSRGTDPTDADSDDDGVSDGEEIASGSNPLDRTDPLQLPDNELSGGTCSTISSKKLGLFWPLYFGVFVAFQVRRRQ